MTKKKHTNFDLTYAFNSEGKLVNIEDELDMSSLDDLSNSLDSKDLSDFDFTL